MKVSAVVGTALATLVVLITAAQGESTSGTPGRALSPSSVPLPPDPTGSLIGETENINTDSTYAGDYSGTTESITVFKALINAIRESSELTDTVKTQAISILEEASLLRDFMAMSELRSQFLNLANTHPHLNRLLISIARLNCHGFLHNSRSSDYYTSFDTSTYISDDADDDAAQRIFGPDGSGTCSRISPPPSPSAEATPSNTPSNTPTSRPTQPTPSATITPAETVTPAPTTPTASPTPSVSSTSSNTATSSSTVSASPSSSPTVSPSVSSTPANTPSPSPTPHGKAQVVNDGFHLSDFFVGAAALLGLVSLGGTAAYCCRRRRPAPGFAPPDGEGVELQNLEDPIAQHAGAEGAQPVGAVNPQQWQRWCAWLTTCCGLRGDGAAAYV